MLVISLTSLDGVAMYFVVSVGFRFSPVDFDFWVVDFEDFDN